MQEMSKIAISFTVFLFIGFYFCNDVQLFYLLTLKNIDLYITNLVQFSQRKFLFEVIGRSIKKRKLEELSQGAKQSSFSCIYKVKNKIHLMSCSLFALLQNLQGIYVIMKYRCRARLESLKWGWECQKAEGKCQQRDQVKG